MNRRSFLKTAAACIVPVCLCIWFNNAGISPDIEKPVEVSMLDGWAEICGTERTPGEKDSDLRKRLMVARLGK